MIYKQFSRAYNRLKIRRKVRGCDVSFVNWWPQPLEEIWLYKFCHARRIQNVLFGSVFGPKAYLIPKLNSSRQHVFFSCENLEDRFTEYGDHLLHVWDKGIGFEHRSETNYLRFPLWMMYYVDPVSNTPGKEFVASMSKPTEAKPNFATMVASHDTRGNGAGLRTSCFNSLSQIDNIISGGRLLNNSDALKTKFNDDANAFIGSARFNIALENSNARGYCTEKIFRPFLSGTIPIYWGDMMNPEPDIINHEAVIFFNPERPDLTVKEVLELEQNPKLLLEFANQNRLVSNAGAWVDHLMDELERFLRE